MASDEHSRGMHAPHDSALGVEPPETALKAQVTELEAEVKALAGRANTASQRFADYENEIRVLQAQLRQQTRCDVTAPHPETGEGASTASPLDRPGISRFGSFMHARKGSSAPTGRERELEAMVVKEQTRRMAAEKKTAEVNAEIEELSASLFTQANEMVAVERKENAALRAQLEVLERQAGERAAVLEAHPGFDGDVMLKEKLRILEQRDVERRRRLERLEAAQKRIERVETLLVPQ